MKAVNGTDSEILNKLAEDFKALAGSLSEDQLKNLLDIVTDSEYFGNLSNNLYLDDELPNYQLLARPIAKWLLPLWRFQSDSYQNLKKILDMALGKGSMLPLSTISSDLANFSYTLISDFNIDQHECHLRLFGLLFLIEFFNPPNGLDIVFNLLRQDYFFVKSYISGSNAMAFKGVLCQLGYSQIDHLYEFLMSLKVIPEAKVPVFGAIASISSHESSVRLQAVNYITKYIKHLLQPGKGTGDIQNIESYAYSITTNKVSEALPLLKRIYERKDFIYLSIHSFKDIESMNSLGSIQDDDFYSVTAFLDSKIKLDLIKNEDY